ncbi:MAG: hypothetical protein GY856_09745, partial [bacterium]|nr:hypothetical protein [bacterium]
ILRVDCSTPQVQGATFDRESGTIEISLSEELNVATAIGDGSGLLSDADEHTAGTGTIVTGSDAAAIVTIQLDTSAEAWWRERSVRLQVGPSLADIQGNQVSGWWETVFHPSGSGGLTGGFLSGEAYDDTTGRPLADATASLYLSGTPLPGSTDTPGAPVAQATTDTRGRYVMTGDVAAGRYAVVLEHPDYTRVVRSMALEPSTGHVPFDSRLTPIAATAGSLDPVNGGSIDSAGHAITFDPNAIPSLSIDPNETIDVTITPISGQGLPDFLPLGWTPLAAAEVRLTMSDGTVLPEGRATPFDQQAVDLDLPLPEWVTMTDQVVAVRYSLAAGVWQTLADLQLLVVPGSDPEIYRAEVELDGPGTVAVLLPDSIVDGDPATAPPAPTTAEETLRGVVLEQAPELMASVSLDPQVVAPTQSSTASVVAWSVDGVTAWPAGLAVQTYLEERLILAGGAGQLLEAPYVADLLLYHPKLTTEQQGTATAAASGAMSFIVSPSERASQVLLEVGYEKIRLYPFPELLERGHVIGPMGGSITTADGVELSIPEGGLPERTVIKTTLLSEAEIQALGLEVDGFDIVAAVRTDLAGHTLTRAATLKLSKEVEGTPQLIVGELVEYPADGRESFVQLVSRATAVAGAEGQPGRIIAAPEPAGSALPLEGIRHEALYLVLSAQAPIGYATGFVQAANGYGLQHSRVVATSLGTADLSRDGGRYTAVVSTASPSLDAWHPTLDERATGTIPSLSQDQVYPLDLTVQPIPPEITDVVPAQGSEGVAVDHPIVQLTFSEPIDETSVVPSTLRLELLDANGLPTGTYAPTTVVMQGPTTVRCIPTYKLRPGRTYQAIFSGGVRDLGGIPYQGPIPYTWSFTTTDENTFD